MNRRAIFTHVSDRAPRRPCETSTVRKKLLGVWKLVSCESKDKAAGRVGYPYGTNPLGRITYDAAGRMSAQQMKRKPSHTGTASSTFACARAST
jgi:hypothetical protein